MLRKLIFLLFTCEGEISRNDHKTHFPSFERFVERLCKTGPPGLPLGFKPPYMNVPMRVSGEMRIREVDDYIALRFDRFTGDA